MDNIIYTEIVDKLVKLRKKHELAVGDMADYVGVTRQSIYNFESGNRKSYKIMLSYTTHPVFTGEELEDIYNLMGS